MVDNKDEESYNFVYAQLMKIFVSESASFKDSKLTEAELDDNIITAKNVFVLIKNDYDEVKAFISRYSNIKSFHSNYIS